MTDSKTETVEALTQKPPNFFWVVAGVALLLVAWQDLSVLTTHIDRGNVSSPLEPLDSIIVGQAIRTFVMFLANYLGLALIVELIDGLRWRMMSEAERVQQRPKYLMLRTGLLGAVQFFGRRVG